MPLRARPVSTCSPTTTMTASERRSHVPERHLMSSSTSTSTSGGVGFGGLLALVFIVLKLTGVIAWSWVWVLAPVWIPLALVFVVLIVAGLAYLIFGRSR